MSKLDMKFLPFIPTPPKFYTNGKTINILSITILYLCTFRISFLNAIPIRYLYVQMPFSCIIVDHDSNSISALTEYINISPHLRLEISFDNAISALEYIQLMDHPIDILFTEIEMPELTGLQLANTINHKVGMLVLMSCHVHYAVDGYFFNARHFLTKPFDYPIFDRIISHIIQQTNFAEDFIIIKLSGKNQSIKICLKDIIGIQSASNYLKVHTIDKTYIPYGSLQAMEETLSHSSQFMRISRSVIINTNCIISTDRYRIKLENDIQVNVGESYQKAFDRYFRKIMMKSSAIF